MKMEQKVEVGVLGGKVGLEEGEVEEVVGEDDVLQEEGGEQRTEQESRKKRSRKRIEEVKGWALIGKHIG